MSQKISVTLTGPAKIAGKWHKSGGPVEVDLDLAKELEAVGTIAPLGDGITIADLALRSPVFEVAAIDVTSTNLVADLAAARQRLSDADIEVERQHARIMQLEADLATATESVSALQAEVDALKAEAAARTDSNAKGGQSADAGGEAAPAADAATAPKTTRKKAAGASDQG